MLSLLYGTLGLGIWGYIGGFDWVVDSIECYNYTQIAKHSEFFIEHNMNFQTYDLWRTSVIHTWEFNKIVGEEGGYLEWIDPHTYEELKFMVTTYQQEPGMYNFFKVYV